MHTHKQLTATCVVNLSLDNGSPNVVKKTTDLGCRSGIFTGQMIFLIPNQQQQSIEDRTGETKM